MTIKSKILTACLCLALFGSIVQGAAWTNIQPTIGQTTVQNNFPNIFRPIGNFFKSLFGRHKPFVEGGLANVNNLTLSRNEVIADCSTSRDVNAEDMKIGIYALVNDPENDALTYRYIVSGGKIIGEGARVIWDLSGEKPGIYKITAGVDDGCGVCGAIQVKEIRVIECVKP